MNREIAKSDMPDELRIVAGVDGSPGSLRALDYAADQAAASGSILQIVTVYNGLPAYGIVTPIVLDQEGAESVVQRAMERVRAAHAGIVTKGEIIYGVPGDVLADVSKGALALIVGTRGRSQVVGALLGSVSEHVIHHGHCATTVVR